MSPKFGKTTKGCFHDLKVFEKGFQAVGDKFGLTILTENLIDFSIQPGEHPNNFYRNCLFFVAILNNNTRKLQKNSYGSYFHYKDDRRPRIISSTVVVNSIKHRAPPPLAYGILERPVGQDLSTLCHSLLLMRINNGASILVI